MRYWKLSLMLTVAAALVGAGLAVVDLEADELPPGSVRAVADFYCTPTRHAGLGPENVRDALTCEDLAAQRSMATSTRNLVSVSIWQLVLAALALVVTAMGTIAVVLSLAFSRRALQLTQMSLAVQQETARHELRAYLAWDPPEVTTYDLATGEILVTYPWKNVGATPARNVRRWMFTQLVPGYPTAVDVALPRRLTFETSRVVPPGTEFGCFTGITVTPGDRGFETKAMSLVVTIIWAFEDIFGETQSACYSEIRSGPGLQSRKMNPAFKGEHPDIPDSKPSTILTAPVSPGGLLSIFKW